METLGILLGLARRVQVKLEAESVRETSNDGFFGLERIEVGVVRRRRVTGRFVMVDLRYRLFLDEGSNSR